MKVRTLENTSKENVNVNLGGGCSVTLTPGQKIAETEVKNLDEIKCKTKAVLDLGEIKPVHEGKQYLRG